MLVVLTAPAPPSPYPLSLHDALPILTAVEIVGELLGRLKQLQQARTAAADDEENQEGDGGTRLLKLFQAAKKRSEEHTSELQSRLHLVCRLLLEKKKHYKLGPVAVMI